MSNSINPGDVFRRPIEHGKEVHNHLTEAVTDYMSAARQGFFKRPQDSNTSSLLPELSFSATDNQKNCNPAANQPESSSDRKRLPYNRKELGAQIVRDNFDEIDLDGDGFLRKRELKIFNRSQSGRLERSSVGEVIDGYKHIKGRSNDQVGKEVGLSKADLDEQLERIQTYGKFHGHPAPESFSPEADRNGNDGNDNTDSTDSDCKPEPLENCAPGTDNQPQKPEESKPPVENSKNQTEKCEESTPAPKEDEKREEKSPPLEEEEDCKETNPQSEEPENCNEPESGSRLPYNRKELGAQTVLDNFENIDLDGDGFLRKEEIKIFNKREMTSQLGKKAVGDIVDSYKHIKDRSNDQVGKEVGLSEKDLLDLINSIQQQGRFRGHQ